MFVSLFALLLACGHDPKDSAPETGDTDTGTPWPDPDPSTWRTILSSAADIGALAIDTREVKYTAPIDGIPREEPIMEDCYFQDMAVYPWHMFFLRAFAELRNLDLDTYTAWVVTNDTRRWWGGQVRLWPGTPHPSTGRPGVFAWSFWSDESGGGTTVDMVAEVQARMLSCAPWSADLAIWVPDGSDQLSLSSTMKDSGIPWLPMEYLRDAISGEGLMLAEAEGTLALGKPEAGQILVAASIPSNLPEVAGLVVSKADPDDPTIAALVSRGVPVSISPGTVENAVVEALAGHPIHLTVTADGVDIYPTRPEETR